MSFGFALLIAGCAKIEGPDYPSPLRYKKSVAGSDTGVLDLGNQGPETTGIADGPATPLGRTSAEPFASAEAPKLSGEKISVTFDGIPLPTFINTVFNELLKVTFEIEDAVGKREQLVTLRTAEPIAPNDFYRLVGDVLSNYGISVVYQNGVYRVIESANRRQDLPRIISARAAQDIPSDMRPVFQFVQLKNVQTQYLMLWLQMALSDRIKVQAAGIVNGVLIMGKNDDVAAAVETIEVLDQPHMAGAKSMRITPVYWSADKLADQLNIVLQAEGYSADIGPAATNAIKLVPVPALNTIIVFTSGTETMAHVVQWAKELDQPGQTINRQGMFYYQVENSSAANLVAVLSGVLSPQATDSGRPGSVPNASGLSQAGAAGEAGNAQPAVAAATTLASGGTAIVDTSHNAIIFQGTAEEFSQFRTMAKQMDRPPLEVLIEATIAEVTLNEGEDLSVALTFDDAVAPAGDASFLRSEAGLMMRFVRDKGSLLSRLNASANKNRVSILSSPRVVASNGIEASIQVGTQVPIITTQQTSPTGTVGGNSTLLQDVQYRSTGVLLSIKPTINSRNRVELAVSQEVSEAQANKISTVSSPAIFTRSINTTLSLNDGETVLLGGLISENYSDGDNGVPYLKDIPLLGNLFKNQSRGRTRIELVVLLTPYIIDSPETGRMIRDAFRDELRALPEIDLGNSPLVVPAAN